MVKGTLRFRNKKGIEAMVSYVVLVLIAISISVFVYSYLRLYTPEDRRECEIDSVITITNISCIMNVVENYNGISFEMENRGLFNISGAFVKFDTPNRRVKSQISDTDARILPPLAPGETHSFNYLDVNTSLGVRWLSVSEPYELEIEPAILQDGYLVPCKDNIVTYPVTCRAE